VAAVNVARHVERAAAERAEAVAVRFDGRTIDYGTLEDCAARLAGALRHDGVAAADRVALYLPNGTEFVVAYLAIQKLGAIAVSINSSWKQDEVRFALADSGACLAIVDPALEAHVDRPSLPGLRAVLTTDALPALIDRALDRVPAVDLPASSPSAIVFSSGTTGDPKGCTLSHGNVRSNSLAKVEYLQIAPDDRLLLFVPLFHCFGQNAILNAAFAAGASVVLERRFSVERILEVIASERPTMFFGPPPAFAMLLERASAADLAPVRYFFSAAAPLPVSVAVRWQEIVGRPIHEGYGLSETSPFASYNHRSRLRLGSIGTPIRDVSMRVVDPETGDDRPANDVGEIAIRGPNVMLGYWNRPEETASAVRNGWFHTGDLGYCDDEGYFFLVDRLKDVVNVGGFKVSPAEVERTLLAHPAVVGAGVTAISDRLFGEQVAACIVRAPGRPATEQDLIAFCRDRLAAYKAPVKVCFVTALPISPTGKLLRRELRRTIERGQSR
jgi:long-chain acyl-CoA synthetase